MFDLVSHFYEKHRQKTSIPGAILTLAEILFRLPRLYYGPIGRNHDDWWLYPEEFENLRNQHQEIGLHSKYNCIPNDKIHSCPNCKR